MPAREMKFKPNAFVAGLLAVFLLTACATGERPDGLSEEDKIKRGEGKLFGDIVLVGPDREEEDSSGGGIGVNGFLWRASLDTLAFLPLASADPFGGVIITDWYSPPESPDERFKVQTYILGRQLRSDGVRVAVFREKRDDANGWVAAEVESETAPKLEGAILSRARELRIASAAQ